MERAARLYQGDLPFVPGVTVVERIGAGECAAWSMVKVVLVLGGLCRVSSGRWYCRGTGAAARDPRDTCPPPETVYRALHSEGYIGRR
jgi:hypothetical protein